MLGIADDRDVAMSDAAVLDRLDRGRGQIDDDIAIVEGKIEPRQTVGAGGELLEAHRRRNVDRPQRRAGHYPGLAQPHARLEAFHRRRQPGVPRQAALLPPRPDRPRSQGACVSLRPPGLSSPGRSRRCRSASRRRRRSPHSVRTPWRWQRKCRAASVGSGSSRERFRAAAGAERLSFGFGAMGVCAGTGATAGGGLLGVEPAPIARRRCDVRRRQEWAHQAVGRSRRCGGRGRGGGSRSIRRGGRTRRSGGRRRRGR